MVDPETAVAAEADEVEGPAPDAHRVGAPEARCRAGPGSFPQRMALDPGRYDGRLESLAAPGDRHFRAIPGRQFRPSANGPFRDRANPRRTRPAHFLVPLSRARVAAIPALPEHPGYFDGPGRTGGRPGRGLPVVALPPVVPVAGGHLPLRPAAAAAALGSGARGGHRAVPAQRTRDRVRTARLPVGGLRRLDPALGVLGAPVRLGAELARGEIG